MVGTALARLCPPYASSLRQTLQLTSRRDHDFIVMGATYEISADHRPLRSPTQRFRPRLRLMRFNATFARIGISS